MLNTIALILALSATFSVQEERPTLAQAALLEEKPADGASQALAIYKEIAGNPAAATGDRFRAGLGVARCLARLGRSEEAAAALKALAPEAALDRTHAQLLEEERARLDHAAQEEDPIKKQVLDALRLGVQDDFRSRIHALGTAALPAMRKIMLNGIKDYKGSNPAMRMRWMTQALLEFDHPDIPGILSATLAENELPLASECLHSVSAHASARGDRRFDEFLFAAATEDPRSEIRKRAGQTVSRLPNVPRHVWQALLRDPDDGVLEERIGLVFQAIDRIDATWVLPEFEKLAQHPSIRARRRVALHLHAIYRIESDSAIALARRLLQDPIAEIQMSALSLSISLAQDGPEDLWDLALASPHPEVRSQAAFGFGDRITDTIRTKIIPLLGDPAAYVRSRAAMALRTTPPANIVAVPGVEAMLVPLLEDPDSDTRRFALTILAYTADASLAARIAPFLHSEDSAQRWAAFVYIHRLDLAQWADAVGAQLAMLKSMSMPWEQSQRIRTSAPSPVQWIIRTLGNESCRPILAAIAKTGDVNEASHWSHELIQGISRDAIPDILSGAGNITNPRILTLFMTITGEFMGSNPAAREYYRHLLSHGDTTVREAAALALARFGTSEDADALVDALLDEPSQEGMDAMANALAVHAGKRQISMLKQTWQESTDSRNRERCLLALSRIRDPEATGVLVSALREDRAEREMILNFLRAEPLEEAYPLILEIIQGKDLSNGEAVAAVEVLKRFAREDSIPALMRLIETNPNLIQGQAHYLRAGDGRGSKASYHPSLDAIRTISEEKAVAIVRTILESTDSGLVQERAVSILAFIPGSDANRLILQSLEHPQKKVRVAAAEAAGHALLAEAIPLLRIMARNADQNVYIAAEKALLRMTRLGVTAP